MIFKGSMTAVVTPFCDGKIDEQALKEIVDWQIASGTDVIVPCGTTGEAATLSCEEYGRIVRLVVEVAAGRAPVLAGAGSNSTANAIKLAKAVRDAGADGQLQVTPYYNKPTQEGLFRHFSAIAEVVNIPMVVYNVPGRTSVNMLPETVLRLAERETIVGVKEASGKIEQAREIIAGAPKDFAVLSGDDAMNLEIYEAGGMGCISVTGNVVPKRVAAVWDAFSEGRANEAKRLHSSLSDINRAMFLETNPIPAKTALSLMGRCREEFRLPMTPMGEKNREELEAVLRREDLL